MYSKKKKSVLNMHIIEMYIIMYYYYLRFCFLIQIMCKSKNTSILFKYLRKHFTQQLLDILLKHI